MRNFLAITLFFAALVCAQKSFAQSGEPTTFYTLELCKQDSFFLVIHSRDVPTKEQPWPQEAQRPIWLKSKEDLEKLIDGVRTKAAEDRKNAKALNAAATEGEKAAIEIDALLSKNETFFKH